MRRRGARTALVSNPPLRQYKAAYYRIHQAEQTKEKDVFPTDKVWSVDASAIPGGRQVPAEVRVKVSQLREWEAMSCASLGVLNHLDWFLSTVLTVISDGQDASPEGVEEVQNLLTSAGVALNHIALIQARPGERPS